MCHWERRLEGSGRLRARVGRRARRSTPGGMSTPPATNSRVSMRPAGAPTGVGLLTLAKVSHKACSTTAVKKAPRTRQSRVACPTLSLSPQDSAHQPCPSHVTGRRGQAAHQEYLIQDPEVALGGDQGGEPVAHRLQAREARRGSNTQNYARRLRAVAPYEVEDEGHDQLGRLLYETDKQLGQKA